MLDPAWIISLQLYLPVLFAAGLLLPIPALSQRKVAWIYSATTSSISLLMTCIVFWAFDWSRPHEMQLFAEVPWLPQFGLTFQFGVDGVSIWLVGLATFLMPVVVLGSLLEVDHDMRAFHFWLHILEACLIGTFIARDVLMFYACFEFSLIPLLFLIGMFGHKNKLKAAKVYFYYSFTGSVFLLAGILYVAWFHFDTQGFWSFNIVELIAAGQAMSVTEQCWVLASFLAAFAIKTPMWPFHTWLPLAHTEAPTAGSVDLAGLVLKLGPYGLLRIAIPLAPAAAALFAPYLGVFAVLGVIVTALICWVQTDAKKLIAYSSVSHMGFVMLGLFAFDGGDIGATGAMYYLIAHGLASGGLFLCLGMLYDRFHTRDLREMGGLAKEMPMWSFFFILFALAAVGLPGLNGFVGEFLTMMGTANSPDGVLGWSFAVAAATGVILAAIYMLYCVGRLCFGPLKLPEYVPQKEVFETAISKRTFHGMSRREVMTVGPISVACVVLGLYPTPMLSSMEPVVQANTAAVKAEIAKLHGAPTSTGEAVVIGTVPTPEETIAAWAEIIEEANTDLELKPVTADRKSDIEDNDDVKSYTWSKYDQKAESSLREAAQ
ncbi:NADH-quinone oxidoreductase subunit M [Algisphaera agarilytica]|uniref:NADH-quinone oxidoreductase subunit M n=1 Tax=Algisphaera agarilytica TaxID=1385975 RepID=A0A7X0HBC1_9BACT|nr:NADH-quinone oxidoreductase subunit M [Algisphaera agarilytica]MBB6431274.1 NADH-quinone oxidoreductase subunit M [Algisphaera agarilytica]